MRVLQTQHFAKFASKSGIRSADLLKVVRQMSEGLIDADLGGGLFKQRVARPGAGKSGGFRTILIYRSADRAIFVHGFAKNKQANISAHDLLDLQILAGRILGFTPMELDLAVRNGDFLEVKVDAENKIP